MFGSKIYIEWRGWGRSLPPPAKFFLTKIVSTTTPLIGKLFRPLIIALKMIIDRSLRGMLYSTTTPTIIMLTLNFIGAKKT